MRYPDDFDDIVVTGLSDLRHTWSQCACSGVCIVLSFRVNNGVSPVLQTPPLSCPGHAAAPAKIVPRGTKRLLEKIPIAFPNGYPSHPEDVGGSLANFDAVGDVAPNCSMRAFCPC